MTPVKLAHMPTSMNEGGPRVPGAGGDMATLLPFLLVSVLLAGRATPYQRPGLSGGYSEKQLGENLFQVAFWANVYTIDEQATDFALLHAAEGSHYREWLSLFSRP